VREKRVGGAIVGYRGIMTRQRERVTEKGKWREIYF